MIRDNAAYSRSGISGIIRQADAAVVEEAGEQLPAPQHVIHRLGHRGVFRQLPALGLHPVLEVGQHRRAELLAHGKAMVGGLAIDPALDVEQHVDPLHRLQRQRRDRRRVLAPSRARRDVGKLEELAPRMRPTRSLGDRSRRSAADIEGVVAGIDVGLEDAGERLQVA